jgi:NADPH:quinone reductase-like Zn-dependent oxidoreductase
VGDVITVTWQVACIQRDLFEMKQQWDTVSRHDRFDPREGRPTMKAVVTAGNGGYEKLQCREVRLPELDLGEVLLQVLAAGVNNTEINTRVGWYSSSVTTGTEDAAVAGERSVIDRADGGWNERTPFPFIQGTDCCGRIVAVAPGGDESTIGSRVLVRACMRRHGFDSMENIWMGSDFDGAFAQFVKVPAAEVFSVDCNWSDAELATIPCAYGTAENMVHRSTVSEGAHVLVTGASGGVGSAAVQLAKRRGAIVTAIAGKTKMKQVLDLGAHRVIDREDDVVDALGENAVDVIIDNVAGSAFAALLRVLKRGGTYASSGAIGGPVVTLDMRTFYLKDLTLIGCTAWDEPIFPDLISYIQRGELRPLVAKTFPLERIADAQQEFLEKRHVGNFVLIPPPSDVSFFDTSS